MLKGLLFPRTVRALIGRRRRRFWHATLRLRTSTSSSTEGGSEPNLLLRRAELKVVLFQILLDGAEPRDPGTTGFCCLLQSAGGEANRILLASALSSMRIICPNRVLIGGIILMLVLYCLEFVLRS